MNSGDVSSPRATPLAGVVSSSAARKSEKARGSGTASSPLPFLAGGDLYKQ